MNLTFDLISNIYGHHGVAIITVKKDRPLTYLSPDFSANLFAATFFQILKGVQEVRYSPRLIEHIKDLVKDQGFSVYIADVRRTDDTLVLREWSQEDLLPLLNSLGDFLSTRMVVGVAPAGSFEWYEDAKRAAAVHHESCRASASVLAQWKGWITLSV